MAGSCRAAWQRLHGDEEGMALVTVIGLTAVLTIVAVVALTFAANAQRPARQHQDWNAALAAAEAGLDDYLARLNRDTAYWATATAADPMGNDALDPDAWAELADSDAYYHYTVDSSRTNREGIILVRSTGYVNGQMRTVEASFRPAGFLDYVYFTDLETVPPAIDPNCSQEYYFDDPGRNCIPIRFVTGDVIDGPLRTNDRIQIDGDPRFLGPVLTWWRGDPAGPYWHDQGGSSDPQFEHPDGIEGPEVQRLQLPATNQDIKNKTSPLEGGCLYHGPTYIRFAGDEMLVWSPLTPQRPSEDWPNPNCFDGSVTSLGGGTNDPNAGAVVDLTDPSFNGVIYVEETDWSGPCNSSTHPLGLPRNNEQHAPDEYPCGAGDVFVWGELDGQITLAARRDVHVIWDLTYADPNFDTGRDLLGLVADRDIKVRHPVRTWAPWPNLGSTSTSNPHNLAVSGPHAPFPAGGHPTPSNQRFEDPEIHAALVALNGTFTLQNFHRGEPFRQPFHPDSSRLTVRGAIAQKYRGPVGVGGNPITRGILKDYQYDFRLQWLSPPFFITPEDSEWLLRIWAELRNPDDLPPPPS